MAKLNRLSLRKVIELNNEVDDRIALCKRANGTPVLKTRTIRFNNKTEMELTTVTCINGICEVCQMRRTVLYPHEKIPRSKGGKLNLKNSIMVDNHCHQIKQSNYPRWSKKDDKIK